MGADGGRRETHAGARVSSVTRSFSGNGRDGPFLFDALETEASIVSASVRPEFSKIKKNKGTLPRRRSWFTHLRDCEIRSIVRLGRVRLYRGSVSRAA